MSCTSAYRSALSFAVPPCPVGAPGLAIVGVFVPRYETDSTFASTSLQRNETVIAFASDERPFLGHFDPAKVLSVSRGRAAWPAKVLLVSRGRAVCRAKVLLVSKLPRRRVLCAKKFALLGLAWLRARKNSPCEPKMAEKRCFQARWASFFAGEPLDAPCWANFFAGEPLDAPCRANFFAEVPLQALMVSVRMHVGSPCGCLSSAGEKFRMQFPSRHFKC